MASLDDFLAALFASLGPVGSLIALLLIFAVDAALFPALPEAWILITYTFRPESLDPMGWAALLLLVAVAGDLLGTSVLYALVHRLLVRGERMPRWLESGMRRWTEFLVVPDERVILLNRIAPVVPFVGAFIATLRWDYRRSMIFVAIGGLAKYAALLYLVFVIGVAYDPRTARTITLVLVVVVVALSVTGSWLYRRRKRMQKPEST
jgi:membrane protein DedA with SNARE-associated domain